MEHWEIPHNEHNNEVRSNSHNTPATRHSANAFISGQTSGFLPEEGHHLPTEKISWFGDLFIHCEGYKV